MLKKDAIIAQIDARLRGDIDDEELVTWAHQCFLDHDLDESPYDEEWEDVIDDVIFGLQQCDEPDVEMSEQLLKDLRDRLVE